MGGYMEKYLMALDQGTTSCRTIIFEKNGRIKSSDQEEFPQIYPKPGWVEHNPKEILSTQLKTMREALKKSGLKASDIAAIGITNQRETTVVWDRKTGEPLYNAIVWQCRRTSDYCNALKKKGYEETIRNKTGLVADAYFSGTKLRWIIKNVEGVKQKMDDGEICFGTIDSWLLFNLTKDNLHITDYTNASRTMLYNIFNLEWDKDICEEFEINTNCLPLVKPSSEVYGLMDSSILGAEIPISGIAGDQHAALFGQLCLTPGSAKNTYGTGCFLLINTGEKPVLSKSGLLTTIGYAIKDKVIYALEGSIFIGGAVVQWLRDELKIISASHEIEDLAASVHDNGGVYFVPAFVGLGAPYWDMYARGTIVGLSRGSNQGHIARAALEAIAYQSRELADSMNIDAEVPLSELKVDGGAVANNLLMQFQADILNVKVIRPFIIETTALGAAYLAGLAVGYYSDVEELQKNNKVDRIFSPKMSQSDRERYYRLWKKAVDRSRGWEEELLE